MSDEQTDQRWPSSLMWYTAPSDDWKEGLPIGNGMLAGMLVGNIERERLALNHEWLWRGKWRHRKVGQRHQHLPQIRELFFAGKLLEAGKLATEKLSGLGGMSGVHCRVDPYQPAGDLFIESADARPASYRRALDLDRALAAVSYATGSRQITRQYFAHAALPIIAVRLLGSEPFDVTLRLERIKDPECHLVHFTQDSAFGFEAKFMEAVRFAVEARIFTDGAVSKADSGAGLRVAAREATVMLSIAVDHDDNDPLPACRAQLDSIPEKDFDALLDSHVKAHRGLYRRVRLELGGARDQVPTDQRIAALRDGASDPGLFALYTNFGRYLLISSSRPGGLVMNLQGKWNEELNPPWECDLHHDINIQMHHWPAEPCGLAECLDPLWEHLERFIPSAREVARALYDCRGVVYPIQTDPWGRATPESYGWDVWTGAAAWLAQHLWRRYEYGLDTNFLRGRAYPFFREVAAFYEDYLVRHPTKGWLVTAPSQSPENTFVGGTEPVSLCIASTSDIALIRDLLSHAIAAAEILGVDPDLREKWAAIVSQLPPYQVGRHGQLQEWLEDYEEREPGHRHFSHLIPLYPGDEFTLENNPSFTRAARVSLERRLASEGGHTGWSRSWTVCLWARLREAEQAYQHLVHLLTDFATTSLLSLHPPRVFQIDGNLGGTAGVCEMLLQSHRGIIRVLPALPRAWARGRFTGLHATAGFVVDAQWQASQPHSITIHSTLGGACRLTAPGVAKASLRHAGSVLQPKRDGEVIEFPTSPGQHYELAW